MRSSIDCDWLMRDRRQPVSDINFGRFLLSWSTGRTLKVILAFVVSMCVPIPSSSAIAISAQSSQPALEEFVPIAELPETDRLPAAPFLVAAYSVVWILAFGYFWLLSRRFSEVERDLAELKNVLGDDLDAK